MYEMYADDIYRFLYVHTRDQALSEDLMADTFLRAWNHIDSFDFKHARAWLYKIAQNILTDHWRKKKTLPLDESIEIVDDNDSLEEVLDKTFAAEQVMDAVSRLDTEQRSLVALRFMQGYNVRQTAESLGLSEANVRVKQYRALKRLRILLRQGSAEGAKIASTTASVRNEYEQA